MIFSCDFDWPNLIDQGLLPPDWASVWYDYPIRLVSTVTSPLGGYVLNFDSINTSDGTLAQWYQPDIASSKADVDILVLANCTGSTPFTASAPILVAYRGQGEPATSSNSCYVYYIDSSGAVNLYRKDAGVNTQIASFSRSNSVNTWYWMRVRANGDQHQIKCWEYGEGEPHFWQASCTDATYTDGYVGIGSEGNSFSNVEANFAYISVATEGQEPRAPLETTLSPDLNTIKAFKSKLTTDGSSTLLFLGLPNRTVQWTLASGDGILTPITNYTDAQGRAYAKYDPGTLGAKVIEVTYGT